MESIAQASIVRLVICCHVMFLCNRLDASTVSIARISSSELPNHSPQAIRFTALDDLKRSRTFESRVRGIEPGTNL